MLECNLSVYCQTDSFLGRIAQEAHNIASQILLVIMTTVISLEVFFRYFLGAGFTWSQEVCSLSFLLLVFLCQAHTWQQDEHIRMDIFYNKFNKFFKKLSDIFTIICGSILYAALAWQGMADLQYQLEVNDATPELMWPLWPFSMAVVLSSVTTVLLLLRFFFISFIRRKH